MTDITAALPAVSTTVLGAGLALVLIGLWGMLSHKHLIRIVIGFSLLDTGVHMVMVSIGYVSSRTAPIIDEAVDVAAAASQVIDPLPSALVLTAIVISFGMTAFVVILALRARAELGNDHVDGEESPR